MNNIKNLLSIYKKAFKAHSIKLENNFKKAMDVAVPGKEKAAFDNYVDKFYRFGQQNEYSKFTNHRLNEKFKKKADTDVNCTWETEFIEWAKKEDTDEIKIVQLGEYIVECKHFDFLSEYKNSHFEKGEIDLNDERHKTIQIQSTKKNLKLTLSNVFKEQLQYIYVMNALVEYGYCAENTYKYIFKERGKKIILCALLNLLDRKGYFIEREYKNTELQEIALNTFGISIDIRTFQDHESYTEHLKRFDFIKSTRLS